jgi:peroxiredoxin Q/BCP
MNRRTWILSSMTASAGAMLAQAPAPASTLKYKVGDEAPDFTLPDTDNKPVKLSDYRGKKNVVLSFFPAAFTAGWTTELTGYQSGINKFSEADSIVLAVGTDFIATLNHWKKELQADFPMMSDYKRVVVRQYGVLNEQSLLINRTTFVIDMQGKIVNIIENRDAIDVTGALVACTRLKKGWSFARASIGVAALTRPFSFDPVCQRALRSVPA